MEPDRRAAVRLSIPGTWYVLYSEALYAYGVRTVRLVVSPGTPCYRGNHLTTDFELQSRTMNYS